MKVCQMQILTKADRKWLTCSNYKTGEEKKNLCKLKGSLYIRANEYKLSMNVD